jgi:hypothetical protein
MKISLHNDMHRRDVDSAGIGACELITLLYISNVQTKKNVIAKNAATPFMHILHTSIF